MNTLQQIAGSLATTITTTLMGVGAAIVTTNSTRAAFIFSSHFGFGFIMVLALIAGVLCFQIKSAVK